jgi:hypothetical protein
MKMADETLELPVMLPDGKTAIMFWHTSTTLPEDGFVLEEIEGNPGVYRIKVRVPKRSPP